MVVVSLDYEDLTGLLGKEVPLAEVEEAITMMGASHKGVEGGVLRMEFEPDRPDLYSPEGVARALKGFLGLEPGLPRYDLKVSGIDFLVDESVQEVRPYVAGGVVRDLTLTDPLVESVVELQERLHTGLGRKRKKVAVGLHDLDRVEPPFRYLAAAPEAVRFVPLGSRQEMSLGEILTDHEKGREYAWILEGASRYPVILDRRDAVLSFPPVINGRLTELTPSTTNLFVDVTGTDRGAVHGALNIVVTALAERGGELRSVTLIGGDEAEESPDLSPREWALSLDRANALLGTRLTAKAARAALERMRLGLRKDGRVLRVQVPAYRLDVLHEVDLVEDLAIGYGIPRLEPILPAGMTVGAAAPREEFTEALRQIAVGHGLQEVRTLVFTDPDLAYEPPEPPLRLANPVSAELRAVRSSLLPGLLEILRLNRRRELPQRLFEVGDVVRGGRNRRLLAGAVIHPTAGFTEVKGLVLGILRDLGLTAEVEEGEDPNLLAGRCARPVVAGRDLGVLGELRPGVIVAYDLANPVVAFELDVDGLQDLRNPSG